MKKIIFSLIFLFILFGQVLGQKDRNKQIPDKYMPIPPNGVWLKSNIFIDQTEIANIHWLEFLHKIYEDSSLVFYQSMLPDTTVWKNAMSLFLRDSSKMDLSESNILHYLRYPGFGYFPLVGITHHQANAYCQWRSSVVTKLLTNSLREKSKNDDSVYVKFRLPTQTEWETAAFAEINPSTNPYGFISEQLMSRKIKNYKKKYPIANCRDCDTTRLQALFKNTNSQIYFTNYLYDHYPNSFGIYNMVGNVAEMIEDKGVCKGGSWADDLVDCAVIKNKKYNKPEAWLGFRCVCEVTFVKKSASFKSQK